MVEHGLIWQNKCKCEEESKQDTGIGHHQLGQPLANFDEDERFCANVRVDTDDSKEVDPNEQGRYSRYLNRMKIKKTIYVMKHTSL